MPSYKDAIDKVLKHEGGYVNHPADRGGRTNYGVTQKVYEEFIGRKLSESEADSVMRNMPIGNAITIYKTKYWDKISGDKIKPYAIAAIIFDQAINRGHVAAIKQAQKILGLPQDGVMGANTLAALNAQTDSAFIPKYLLESANAYKAIVARNPSQAVFLNGWLKRVDSLEKYAKNFIGSLNATTVGISVGLIFLVGIGVFIFAYKYLTTNSAPLAARAYKYLTTNSAPLTARTA